MGINSGKYPDIWVGLVNVKVDIKYAGDDGIFIEPAVIKYLNQSV